FGQFKGQNYLELLHHQWKTPLAVRPVFLKSPRRGEGLGCLLQLALQGYQGLERRYRQTLGAGADPEGRHRTAEGLVRRVQGYGVIVAASPVGRVVHATGLTAAQRRILNQLSFPTPAQTFSRILRPVPTG